MNEIKIEEVIEYVGDGKFNRQYGDMKPFALLLSSLVIATGAKTVVEIGTGTFNSGRALSYGLQFTGGKLYTCDIVKMIEEFPDNVEFILKSSDDLAEDWDKNIDILFIDGDHSYEQVRKDLENYYGHVARGGLVIFHDVYGSEVANVVMSAIHACRITGIVICNPPGLLIHQKW